MKTTTPTANAQDDPFAAVEFVAEDKTRARHDEDGLAQDEAAIVTSTCTVTDRERAAYLLATTATHSGAKSDAVIEGRSVMIRSELAVNAMLAYASEKRDDHRGWHIKYSPPPIPVRDFDWSATHPDYDGAEDANDGRIVHGRTREIVITEIDLWIEENAA